MDVLNKKQVDELFYREAVMINGCDVVPDFRAEALFGAESVKFARSLSGCHYGNGYGVGDYTLMYISYKGFQVAATYYNVRRLQKEDVSCE